MGYGAHVLLQVGRNRRRAGRVLYSRRYSS